MSWLGKKMEAARWLIVLNLARRFRDKLDGMEQVVFDHAVGDVYSATAGRVLDAIEDVHRFRITRRYYDASASDRPDGISVIGGNPRANVVDLRSAGPDHRE